MPKRCTCCGPDIGAEERQRRHANAYARRKRDSDPEAARAKLREWRISNPDKSVAQSRKAYAVLKDDPEYKLKARIRTAAWIEKNRGAAREKARLRAKAWRDANPEAARMRSRASAEKHRDTKRAYQKKFYEENRARLAEYQRKLNREHPERLSVAKGKRRALELAAPGGGILRKDWRERLEEYGEKCAYCLAAEAKTMDHIVPLVKGGSHEIDNVVPACKSCNSSKGKKSLLQFVASGGGVV